MLTRDAILQAQSLKTETVSAPEWGGEVIVSEIGAETKFALHAEMEKINQRKIPDQAKNILTMATLVAAAMVDGNGERIFADGEAKILTRKNLSALARVFNAAARLNGFGTEAEQEIEKNSEPSPGASSPST